LVNEEIMEIDVCNSNSRERRRNGLNIYSNLNRWNEKMKRKNKRREKVLTANTDLGI
jgi:hypothetical protein